MPVDPLSLFSLPLILALTALFAITVFYDVTVSRRRRANRKKAVYRCENCRRIYTAPRRTPLARCPQCGHNNEPMRD
jgi:hypothetical protein